MVCWPYTVYNSVIPFLNLRGISTPLTSQRVKRHNGDGGKLNTVRLTGKPAHTGGHINPGVPFFLFYILWISNRRTSVSYQIGGSTLLGEENKMGLSQCGETTVCIMHSLGKWLTVNRQHPTCRCGTTWQCLHWPDTFWWGWGEEQAAGQLMCHAEETSGSLIHLWDPCNQTHKHILFISYFKIRLFTYWPQKRRNRSVYRLVDADLLHLGN